MLDPVTALSVAGNVVQFVDFGKRVLRQGYLLYTSTNGVTSVNEELDLVCRDLLKFIAKLQWPEATVDRPPDMAETEQELQDLCVASAKIAEELLTTLKSASFTRRRIMYKGVDVGSVARVWDSLWAALRDAWSEEERVALTKRLSVLREAIDTRILFDLR